MKQIQLSDDDAWAHTQALGDLASARFRLESLQRQILERHGVQPPFQIDGSVLTATEETP